MSCSCYRTYRQALSLGLLSRELSMRDGLHWSPGTALTGGATAYATHRSIRIPLTNYATTQDGIQLTTPTKARSIASGDAASSADCPTMS